MFLKCFDKHSDRAEPLYELGLHYYREHDYIFAKKYLKMASKIPFPFYLKLFLDKNIYDYDAKLHLAVVYYYLGKYKKSYDLNMALLDTQLPTDIINLIIKNNNFNLVTLH